MPGSHKIALIGARIDRIATLATDLLDFNVVAMASDEYRPMLACLRTMSDVDAVLLDLPAAPDSCRFAEECLSMGVTQLGTPLFCIGDTNDPVLAELGRCHAMIDRATTNSEIIAQLLAGLRRQNDEDHAPLVPVMDNLFWALRHMHQDQTELFGTFFETDILWPVLVELAFIGPPRTVPLTQLSLTLKCPESEVLRAVTKLAGQRLVETRHIAKGRRRIEVGISRLGAFRMMEYMNRYRSQFNALTGPKGTAAN